MADDELDAVANEFIGDRDALFRVGNVVALLNFNLLAENAALGVKVGGGLLDARGELRPERSVRPGNRPGDANLDLSARRAGKSETGGKDQAGQQILFHT